jgi:hypothetical protein
MPPDDVELTALLQRGDSDGVLRHFAGRAEKERKRLAPVCRTHLQDLIRRLAPVPDLAEMALRSGAAILLQTWLQPDNIERVSAARLAIFCTGGLNEVRHFGLPEQRAGEQIVDALLERRPDWLNKWATRLLEETHHQGATSRFFAMRRLVRAGLIPEPTGAEYICQLIRSLDQPAVLLRDDPTLLDDVLRFFEPNPDIQLEMARRDVPQMEEHSWAWALELAVQQGRLSRDPLLDGTLTVLESDPTAHHARWYLSFHDRLKPTAAESAGRADRYFGLLRARLPQIVGCALDTLTALDAAGPLAAERLAAGLAPALEVMDGKRVKAVLKLLTQAVKREPSAASVVARAACAALGQPKPDLQAAAWEFVERHGDPADAALVESVQKRLDLVAATLQERVRAWLQSASGQESAPPAPAAPFVDLATLRERVAAVDPTLRRLARLDDALTALEGGVLDFAPLGFDGMDVPRLASALEPIADLNTLLEVTARALARAGAMEDFERAGDGVARLCDQRPVDFEARVAPLRAQVERLLHGPDASQPQEWSMMPVLDLARLAEAWLQPKAPDTAAQFLQQARQAGSKPLTACPSPYQGGFMPLILLHNRLQREAAERVAAGIAVPLLATPTHRGGWLDPRALVGRVAEYLQRGLPFAELDAVLALLRLAPEQRGAALTAARALAPAADPQMAFAEELPLALRYALGEDDVALGRTSSLWIAAARARAPRADDARVEARHAQHGPDAGARARLRVTLHARRDPYANPVRYDVSPPPPPSIRFSHITVLRHMPDVDGRVGLIDPRAFSLWPAAPEALFARGALWMADSQEGAHFNAERRRLLEPLLDPDVPLESYATLLLAFGLSAKDGSVHGVAVDILIAAIEDGRLDPERLGSDIAQIASVKLGKYSRWATTLASAARVGPLHVEAIRQTLEHALEGPEVAPREIGPLVDLFLQLCTQCGRGVKTAATRAFLETLPSGKAATAARRLLAFTDVADLDHNRKAQQTLVEHRLARAQRWATTPSE